MSLRSWLALTILLIAALPVARAVGGHTTAVRAMPPRSDCTAHLRKCLETPLGRRGSGRSPNHSICSDCFEVCRGQRRWPDRSNDGKDCQWWNY